MNLINRNFGIPRYNEIRNLTTSNLKFVDVIVLVLHAFENTLDNILLNYFKEFESDITQQFEVKWPELIAKNNDYKKRFDIFCTEPFVRTQNMLTLMIRLLYIENIKKSHRQINTTHHKILDKTIGAIDPTVVDKKLSLVTFTELLQLLELCARYYLTVYYDEFLLEHKIGSGIIKYLNHGAQI